MGNFQICLDATAPLLLYLAAGYLACRLKQIDSQDVSRFNSVVFNFFLTVNQFKSIYFSDLSTAVRPGLILFSVLGVLTSCGIGLALSSKLLPREQRGVMTQGIFRSNFVLIGLYIAETLVPDGSVGSVAVLGAIVIPLFNVLAVVVLSLYGGGRVSFRSIFIKVLKNPLILSTAAGLLCLWLRVPLPRFVQTAVRQMAAVSTPMMLFLLGAFFRFDALSRYRKQVVLGASMKLLVMPAIFLTLGYCLGFRGMEFAALLGVFATSTAVSSFAMTRQLGGDVELSGALIVVTSTLCPFTLFLWCFLFKSLGAF